MPLSHDSDPIVSSPRHGAFREDLDLSAIADQYEAFGGGRIEEKVTRYGDGDAPAYVWQPAPLVGEGEDPARVGVGPLRCSTSRVVAPGRPTLAWDTNGYYRGLGIAWPYVDATRGDLRRAYHAVDGQGSIRLTYYLKQLLDPEVRAAYDAQPLGVEFHDHYTEERLREEAILKAHTRTRAGEFTTPEEMLDLMGYRLVKGTEDESGPKVPRSSVSIDTEALDRFDDPQRPEIVGADWQYAFYLWRTTRWDYARLHAWQSALIAALDQRGIRIGLAVGLMGKQPHPFVIAETDDGPVVFLRADAQVTLGLAAVAAARLDPTHAPELHAHTPPLNG